MICVNNYSYQQPFSFIELFHACLLLYYELRGWQQRVFYGKNSDEIEISDVWTIVHVNTISPVANVALTICHKD